MGELLFTSLVNFCDNSFLCLGFKVLNKVLIGQLTSVLLEWLSLGISRALRGWADLVNVGSIKWRLGIRRYICPWPWCIYLLTQWFSLNRPTVTDWWRKISLKGGKDIFRRNHHIQGMGNILFLFPGDIKMIKNERKEKNGKIRAICSTS